MVASSFASDPPDYDRAAEKAIVGTVKAVAVFPADGAVGVHLDLETAEGLISIHVAPAEFIGRNNFYFYMGDQVEIIGAPRRLTATWPSGLGRSRKARRCSCSGTPTAPRNGRRRPMASTAAGWLMRHCRVEQNGEMSRLEIFR